MYGKFQEHLSKELADITAAGLYKNERLIEGPQQAAIQVQGKEVLNFCANNYLGLSNHPRLIQAAKDMMDRRGYGMSSVRFICGTQDIHKQLEAAISKFFKTEDTILYAACFDANGGVFEPLFTADDAIITRMSGRRVCESCGSSYHVLYKQPKEEGKCDICGGTLVQRKDDHPDTVLARLETYHKETEPLVSYYEKQGKLVTVKGQDDVEATTKAILEGIEA